MKAYRNTRGRNSGYENPVGYQPARNSGNNPTVAM